jgi:hypothetical protein
MRPGPEDVPNLLYDICRLLECVCDVQAPVRDMHGNRLCVTQNGSVGSLTGRRKLAITSWLLRVRHGPFILDECLFLVSREPHQRRDSLPTRLPHKGGRAPRRLRQSGGLDSPQSDSWEQGTYSTASPRINFPCLYLFPTTPRIGSYPQE